MEFLYGLDENVLPAAWWRTGRPVFLERGNRAFVSATMAEVQAAAIFLEV
jgi:hypothetical protein